MFARSPGKMQDLIAAPYIQKEGVDFPETAPIRESPRKALK